MRKRAATIITTITALIAALAMTIPAQALPMLDVSNHQAGINLQATQSPIVVIKLTQANGYRSPSATSQIAQARAAGKSIGIYHYAGANNGYLYSAASECAWFLSNARPYKNSGVVPVLDWEPAGNAWQVAWAKTWGDCVARDWGVQPAIYMNISTEHAYDWSSVVAANRGLWIAGGIYYNRRIAETDPLPKPYFSLRNWPFAMAWQITSSGRSRAWSAGLDLGEFYGSQSTWAKYAGTTRNPTPTPTPTIPTPTPSKTTGVCVVVSRGDTISAIATARNLNPPSAWTVPSGNINRIYPGQQVCYRGAANTSVPSTSYTTVGKGESLWVIAARSGINFAAIRSLNPSKGNLIYPGQQVRIK